MFYWLKKNESHHSDGVLGESEKLMRADQLRGLVWIIALCLSFGYLPKAMAQTPTACPSVTVGEQPGFLGDTTPSLYSGCYYSAHVGYGARQKTRVVEYWSSANRYYGASAEGSAATLYDDFSPSVTVGTRQLLMPITTHNGLSQVPMIVNSGSTEPSNCADEDYSAASGNVIKVTGDWYCAKETSVPTVSVYYKWQAGSTPFELSEIAYVTAISVSATHLSVAESSTTATFTLSLDSKPTADVTINLNSNNPDEGTVNPSSLTFTPSNWNTAQAVTVTGVDDYVADGDQVFSIVTVAAISTDSNYSGLNANDVSVSNVDDDVAGITVSDISGDTSEAGGTVTAMVELNSEPRADVTIGLSSNNIAEGTISPPSLTFTPSNWNVAQTVTVTGVDDDMIDGNQSFSMVTVPAISTDSQYSLLDADDISVTNTDDDSAGIIVSNISLNTSENFGTATTTVKLTSKPMADVTIGLSSNNTAEGTVSPSNLTFTPNNWNSEQTATVTGVDDPVDDGNQLFNIITAPAISMDSHYNLLDTDDVSVISVDDDVAGIIVNNILGTTTSRVSLSSKPTADVIVVLSISDANGVSVGQAILTFTSANWNVMQTVTISSVEFSEVDSQHFVVNTASTDGAYTGLNSDHMTMMNISSDVGGNSSNVGVNIMPIILDLLLD